MAVLDLCDAPGTGVTFLRVAVSTEEGGRLLNVALTRARHAAVVVANVAYLARTGGPVLRQLLDRLRDTAVVIDATELLD